MNNITFRTILFYAMILLSAATFATGLAGEESEEAAIGFGEGMRELHIHLAYLLIPAVAAHLFMNRGFVMAYAGLKRRNSAQKQ